MVSSLFIADISLLVIMLLFSIVYIYKKRQFLKKEGLLYLYKTQWGIKKIDRFATEHKRSLNILQYVAIVCGYILMAIMTWLFTYSVYIYIRFPQVAKAIKAPPLLPLFPYFSNVFGLQNLFPVEFYGVYFVIGILVIATFHEFSHGIFSRFHGLKVKSTGFAFLSLTYSGIVEKIYNLFNKRAKLNSKNSVIITAIITILILVGLLIAGMYYSMINLLLIILIMPFFGAFVEPDEKALVKKPIKAQLSILSAGVFANLVIAFFAYLVMTIIFIGFFAPSGAVFKGYPTIAVNSSSIEKIGGYSVTELNNQQILNLIEESKIREEQVGNYNLTEIEIENYTLYISLESYKIGLEKYDEGFFISALFDSPAVKAGFPSLTDLGAKGAITEVNGVKIKGLDELRVEIDKLKVGEEAKVKVSYNNKEETYDVLVGENPAFEDKPYLGISSSPADERGIRKVFSLLTFYKKDTTYYKPLKFSDLTIFIYGLFWWLALLNLIVALTNMLPLGILDGGRFFYLTILAVTKSEKVAQRAFSAITYLIIALLAILMAIWAFGSLF